MDLLLTFDISAGILMLAFDTMTTQSRLDLLQGTIDLLRTLWLGPMHGRAISERIRQISQDVPQVNQGWLCSALRKLEHRGWIQAKWAVSELGRRASTYHLAEAGRKQLEIGSENWARLTTAIVRIMEPA